MSVKTIRGNLLFWKITTVFSALVILLGIVFAVIAAALVTFILHPGTSGIIVVTSPLTWLVLPSP